MKRRTLLFLSAYSFHARLWRDGTISEEYAFSDDAEGHGEFAAFLHANNDPVLMLTDLIEEDFRTEVVPHLIGRQRHAQQQRKFDQFYRNTLFRQATLQRRQEEGRRDDEMLFSALTNPHLITPWLDIIHHLQIPLIGIYSVPTISTPLLNHVPSDHVLLLSWEKESGLRQSYFNDRRLFLSRLSPLGSTDSFANIVASETARTLQYLKNLSMLPHGEALHVGIICHENDRAELEQNTYSHENIDYHYLDIQELGQQFHVSGNFRDSDATSLLLGLLAIKPPATHYAPPEYTRVYGLHQLRRNLYLGGATIAIACLCWGSVNLWQGHTLNTEGSGLEQQAVQLEKHAHEIIGSFPNQLASPADMKSAVTTIRTLNEYSPSPQAVWSKLSTVLDSYPRIQVDSLAWQTTATSNSSASNGSAIPDLHGPGMVISGEMEGWDGNYRSALNYLDRFQQALRKQGYAVDVLSLPLDVSSKGSITETPGADQQQKPALFSLKLSWSQPQ